MNSILQSEKMRVKNHTKLESEKTGVYAQKPVLKTPFKHYISGNKLELAGNCLQGAHIV
jgi:hypothetical protein